MGILIFIIFLYFAKERMRIKSHPVLNLHRSFIVLKMFFQFVFLAVEI